MSGGAPDRISPAKAAAFRVLGVAFPLALLALAEAALRVFTPASVAADPYINVSPFSLFERREDGGEEQYRITHRHAYLSERVSFPVRKPEGTVRIFALGGSACAGWPHPKEERFDRYLERALENVHPEIGFEIINASAHGFAAYRVRRVFDQVIDLDPDAIIIYSGNNEFLEEREYTASGWRRVALLGEKLRVVQRLRRAVFPPATELRGDELDAARFFRKKVTGEALELRRDPEKFERVVEHYAASIEYMVEQAARRNVPVLLFTVPVNLRDWLPTVSHHALEGEARRRWQELYWQGRRGLLDGHDLDAGIAGIAAMRRALALEPEHAASHYWLGRLLERRGDVEAARASFEAARDLDHNPFRAHGDFLTALRRIAAEREGVTLVDLDRVFQTETRFAAPGFDLFLDYVHPRSRGNVVIAREAFAALTSGAVPSIPTTDRPFAHQPSGYDENEDFRVQILLWGMYAQNVQYRAAAEKVEHTIGLVGGQPFDGTLPEDLPTKMREGYTAFRRHLELEERQIRGEPATAEELRDAAVQLAAFYDRYYPLGEY